MDILKDMGFGEMWRSWIWSFVSSASLSIIVKWSPSDFFEMQKGLRQGDPLSPFLFNLCVNYLSCMLSRAVEIGLVEGIKVGDEVILNHLQFADDTLLFCNANFQELRVLRDILDGF